MDAAGVLEVKWAEVDDLEERFKFSSDVFFGDTRRTAAKLFVRIPAQAEHMTAGLSHISQCVEVTIEINSSAAVIAASVENEIERFAVCSEVLDVCFAPGDVDASAVGFSLCCLKCLRDATGTT